MMGESSAFTTRKEIQVFGYLDRFSKYLLYNFIYFFLTARTLSRSKELLWWQGSEFEKFAVFRHEMFFPVSFWTLLFVTIS